MIFGQATFRREFRRYLRRQLQDSSGVPQNRRALIWEAWATNPDRIQLEIENKYEEAIGKLQPKFGVAELLFWLSQNWQTILKLLFTLIPLIIEADKDEA